MEKKITINKANETIRGTDSYSLMGKRCMNSIYYAYQYNYNRDQSIKQLEYIDLPFSYLRKMMQIEKTERYIQLIQTSLKELEKTIELNHFKHPVHKKEYIWYSDRFLNYAGWFVDENGKKFARIEISKLAKYLMQKQTNFTQLEIKNMNKLRTKYSMKLYEYLKSFSRNYHYLEISQKHLMKLFGFEPDHVTYKHYSKLKSLLERQIKELAIKTEFHDLSLLSDKKLAKQKIYRIIINKKKKEKVELTIAKRKVDRVINRLFTSF